MVHVTIISSADCDNCTEVKEFLEQLRLEQPALAIEELKIDSPGGQELAIEHGILASPGLLIDGKFFSMGKVDKEQLEEKLRSKS